jgi:hypothetical protein
MRSGTRMLAIAFGVAATLGAASPAQAADGVLEPGDSIQAAIDEAQPGDTVRIGAGEFRENLTITTDDITLRGAGSGRHGTTLMPPDMPTPSPCDPEADEAYGICIAGAFDDATGAPATPVTGVTVKHLTVNGFPDSGVEALNAHDLTVRGVRAQSNAGYGIAGFILSGVRFAHNVASNNGEPGIYIGDSPDAQAVVIGNTSIANGVGGEGFGFLLRDANHGLVIGNKATGNCAGFVFIDSSFNPDVALVDWTAVGNTATRNNGACPRTEAFPTFSGTGILLGGTHGVTVTKNAVFGNRPALQGSPFSGGIVVVSTKNISDSAAFAEGTDPTDNHVTRNIAFFNEPDDIRWDRSGSGNRFKRNRCGDSTPARICRHG